MKQGRDKCRRDEETEGNGKVNKLEAKTVSVNYIIKGGRKRHRKLGYYKREGKTRQDNYVCKEVSDWGG